MTTLFLIALWVMRAFLGVTQYITLLLPMREIQTTTVQNHNSSLSDRLSRSTGFLFLNDCLKITSDDFFTRTRFRFLIGRLRYIIRN